MSQKTLNKNILVMVVLVIFVGLGEKMAERFLPLYILAIGGSAWVIGALNSMDNLLSALYSFPGGYMADKFGYKKSLQIFTLVAMTGYFIVLLIPRWEAVLAASVLFISWTAVSLPAIMSLVSKAMPKDKRSFGVSIHSFFRRIPMALGPLIGGALIGFYGREYGVRIAFAVALAMGALALIIVQRYMDDDKSAEAGSPNAASMLKRLFMPEQAALRQLLASDILVRFAEQIPYAFVVIWVVDKNGISAFDFGILTTIEMITAMLVYIPVAKMADAYGKKPFVLMTFGFFTVFPVLLLFSRSFGMLVFAFIVRGLKEFGEPTRKAMILDLAPEDAKAGTFGAYYLVRDIFVSAAALTSAFLWNISPAVNFITASAFGLAGTIIFAIWGKDVQTTA